jgi:hypothetical protein
MLNVAGDNQQNRRWFPQKTWFRRDHCVAAVCRDRGPGTQAKLASLKAMYKPWKPPVTLLPHPVPAVRK